MEKFREAEILVDDDQPSCDKDKVLEFVDKYLWTDD